MEQALARLAEVEMQAAQTGEKMSREEQRARAYSILEKDLALPAGSLAKELPGLALEIYGRPDTALLLRARAAYALNKFAEAERLSLEAAAQDVAASAKSAIWRVVERMLFSAAKWRVICAKLISIALSV